MQEKNKKEFYTRFNRHLDELKWLYMELYDNPEMFQELCDQMYEYYCDRREVLKKRDRKREKNPKWYHRQNMLGMMLYVDNFAGNLKNMRDKLEYIKECNVTFLHLMPFLETTEGKSDGGYAVTDFRKVRSDLGNMDDLAVLADKCHEKGIDICMDFVMNHTSEDHEWAVRAKRGEGEYMSRYFCYHDFSIPEQFEKTVPQVFPTTAPGNFTWIPEMGHHVMTTFYPYQWDLNYKNPRVFNEMMYHFLFFANQGIDIVRLDAVPYIWKELGTSCRNLKQVHTIVRMMRMIGEIVCPGTILLGEVVMEPEKVIPYFGTQEKPECHMLYNVTTMATTWHSLATKDVRLLKEQLDIVNGLPKEYTFLNYLRCHDDIGWGLDFCALKKWHMEEIPHKKFLNDYFTGQYQGSESRGELYNDDPVTKDARFCGTTASMCGIEKAKEEKNREKMKTAIRKDLMLHAYLLMQSGIPMLYSGDEIGQINDYSYKENEKKREDSRYVHRGSFNWKSAEKRNNHGTIESEIFHTLNRMEKIRDHEETFKPEATVMTQETNDKEVLCIIRKQNGETLIGVFNFSDQTKTIFLPEQQKYRELIRDEEQEEGKIILPEFGFVWCKAF
nr:amylosucrase [uncultured Sellimonas sp.]